MPEGFAISAISAMQFSAFDSSVPEDSIPEELDTKLDCALATVKVAGMERVAATAAATNL